MNLQGGRHDWEIRCRFKRLVYETMQDGDRAAEGDMREITATVRLSVMTLIISLKPLSPRLLESWREVHSLEYGAAHSRRASKSSHSSFKIGEKNKMHLSRSSCIYCCVNIKYMSGLSNYTLIIWRAAECVLTSADH